MNKTKKIIAIFLCLLLAIGLSVTALAVERGEEEETVTTGQAIRSAEKKGTDADAPININLTVGKDQTELNFTWYSRAKTAGTLYLTESASVKNGKMKNAVSFSAVSEKAEKEGYYSNHATATGLKPNTSYSYQLVNGTARSPIYTFKTAKKGAFSFAFVGDPQIGAGSVQTDAKGWEETLNRIDSDPVFQNTAFLLSAGDQVNTPNNETEYSSYLEHKALYKMPTATNVGNHDTLSSAYGEHFDVPNESSLGCTPAGGDYYFVYNNVLFLCLNTNNFSAAQHLAFMEKAIAAAGDVSWKIVTFHQSVYSVATHSTGVETTARREMLVPLFQKLGIDVVLMGHDHVYARTYMMDGLTPITDASYYDDQNFSSVTDPDSILYVTANSASGSKFYDIKQNTEFEYARVMNQEYTPNVSKVSISDGTFQIVTYRVTDMSVVDSFTIHHTGKDGKADNADKENNEIPENGGNTSDGTKKGDGASSADSAKSKEGVNTDDPNHLVFWLCFAGGAALGILLVAFVYKRKAVKASLAESEESDEDTEHPAE